MNIKQIDSGKWQIDFTLRGRRIRRVIYGTKRMAAQAIVIEKEKIYKDKYGPRVKKRILLKTYAKHYEETYSIEKRAAENDRYIIIRLNKFLGHKYLDEITPGDIERYKTTRKKGGVGNATINRELGLLKSIFYKVIDSEDYGIDRNPVAKAGLLEEDSHRERILEPNETHRLFNEADKLRSRHLSLFLAIALNTGMRKKEILTLKWEHIDFERRAIAITKDRSKSKKPREVPMNEQLYRELWLVKEGSTNTFVFYNPQTGSHVRHIKESFSIARKKAKIEDFTIHDLRHTAASLLVNECGFSLKEAAEILGHSKIEMTARYVHSTFDRKQRGMAQLGEIVKRNRKEADVPMQAAITDTPPAQNLYN